MQGQSNINGSRDATRESFHHGMIEPGEVWMEMIKSRNQSSNTYNQAVADEIVHKILGLYHTAFQKFLVTMQLLKENE